MMPQSRVEALIYVIITKARRYVLYSTVLACTTVGLPVARGKFLNTPPFLFIY